MSTMLAKRHSAMRCNQRSRQGYRKVPADIATYDLSSVIQGLTVKDPDYWDSELLKDAVFEYRMFLAICRDADAHGLERVVPTGLGDKVWHQHILYTKDYAEACSRLFGHFLHHRPSDATEDERALNATLKQRTIAIMRDEYGHHFDIRSLAVQWQCCCQNG